MGISKSLKRIFGRKKKDLTSSDIGSDTSLKSPKNTRKGGTAQIVRRVSNLKSTGYDPRMGIIPYGAYNPSNAKLVTADSGYPSNYEHYSNFELKSRGQPQPKLKGVNMEDANIYQTRNLYNGMYSSQIINSSDQQMARPVVQRRSSIQRRPSNCSIQGGVPYTASHSQFYSMYQKSNQYPFNGGTSPMPLPPQMPNQMFNDPRQLEATVRKMETYLALLNQIQSQMGTNSNGPTGSQTNLANLNPSKPLNGGTRPILKQHKPVQRSRSTLQPQPDFQEREARKKRKLRRNKDSLAFDLTALKKRLEVISLEENEPDKTGSCGSLGSDQDLKGSRGLGSGSESDKKSDIGYNSGDSGLTTPEKEKSDNSGDDSSNSGDDSSDSGVATPPLQLERDLKLNTKLSNLPKSSNQSDEIFKRRIVGRTRTKSE